jgi:hypothetical protein
MNIYTYENPRPNLTVESVGGANLGRCYNAYTYRVTSFRELKREDIKSLRDSGWLGYGQEYRLVTQEPIVDTYFPKGVNYRGEPHRPCTRQFFVYNVTDVVDSSD